MNKEISDEAKKWEVLDSEYLFRRPWLTARKDKVRLPSGVVMDEYYVLENRQSVGWDQKLGEKGHGLLVVHVDYDREAWVRNRVNAEEKHQRMTFIPANGEYVGGYNAQSAEHLYAALGGQPYPGTSGNDSLTDASLPASSVFTGGFMGQPVNIRRLDVLSAIAAQLRREQVIGNYNYDVRSLLRLPGRSAVSRSGSGRSSCGH